MVYTNVIKLMGRVESKDLFCVGRVGGTTNCSLNKVILFLRVLNQNYRFSGLGFQQVNVNVGCLNSLGKVTTKYSLLYFLTLDYFIVGKKIKGDKLN